MERAATQFACLTDDMATSPGQYGLSDRHFRINPGEQLQEARPPRCPAGHRLGPDQVLVGALPCLCYSATHPRMHRTWRCVRCDACWVWPPCRKNPQWPIWAGVEPYEPATMPF